MIMFWADQGKMIHRMMFWCRYWLLPGQHPLQEQSEYSAVLLRRVEADSLSRFCTLDEYIMQKALVSALMCKRKLQSLSMYEKPHSSNRFLFTLSTYLSEKPLVDKNGSFSDIGTR